MSSFIAEWINLGSDMQSIEEILSRVTGEGIGRMGENLSCEWNLRIWGFGRS